MLSERSMLPTRPMPRRSSGTKESETPLDGLQAGDGLQQLLLAAAGDARDAQDLAGVGGEGHVVELEDALDVAYGQALDLDAGLRVDRIGPLDVQRHGVADHHVGHLLGVGALRRHVADELAVAQDGHAVGQGLDLVHLVGDDDDGLAVVAHVAQHREELVRLLRGEHGGRLVEDQDVRAAVEHLDDLDGLLLRDGHVVDLLRGVDLKAVERADLADLLRGGLQIELAGQAEHDVLGRGEHVDQLEVLVDHADAQIEGVLRRADHDVLSVDRDRALVREIDAGEHVHQRGLAAAVFAQQRQDLAAIDIQPDLVVGHRGAEGLGDVAHFDGGSLVVQCQASFEKCRYAVKSNAGTVAPTLLFAAYLPGKAVQKAVF